jgi:hypothetical protein
VLAPPPPHYQPHHHNLPRRQGNVPQNQDAPQPKPIPATITLQRPNSPRQRTSPLTSLTEPPRQPTLQHQPTATVGQIAQSPRHESPQSAPSPTPATGDGAPGRPCKLFSPQAPAFTPLRRSTSKVPHQPRQRCDAQNRQLFRPKLQPAHQCPIRLPKRPTGYDNPTTLKTASPALQSLAFQDAVQPTK